MFKFKHKTINNNDYEINRTKFDQIKNQAILIDVRDESEFKLLKKIPNCVNIPYYKLIANPQAYLPDLQKTVITICNAGHRSTAAAEKLRHCGYVNAYVLIGGIYGYYK